MPSEGETIQPPKPTVFLSYASEDREQATSLRDALVAAGLDVWFDANELGGGDAWDQKIRRQIKDCDYFMPIISASTEARHEGYFRREWRLAVERSLDMADDHAFLLPVVIDATQQDGARVPDKFLAVQWLKVPQGRSTPGLTDLCRRLLSGRAVDLRPASKPPIVRSKAEVRREDHPFPIFPVKEEGKAARFCVLVLVWALRSIKPALMRLPRWIRLAIYLWAILALVAKGCSSSREQKKTLSPEAEKKIQEVGAKFSGKTDVADLAKVGAMIAKEFADEEDGAPAKSAYLAFPFVSTAAAPEESRLADATFAQAYGRLSISRHGHVQVADAPPSALDAATLADAGKARKAHYVVGGGIEAGKDGHVLTVVVVAVADKSVVWTKSYPVAGADPTLISAEIDAKVPAEDSE